MDIFATGGTSFIYGHPTKRFIWRVHDGLSLNNEVSTVDLDRILVLMTMGDESNKLARNVAKINIEVACSKERKAAYRTDGTCSCGNQIL
jgi:hypothetical protein